MWYLFISIKIFVNKWITEQKKFKNFGTYLCLGKVYNIMNMVKILKTALSSISCSRVQYLQVYYSVNYFKNNALFCVLIIAIVSNFQKNIFESI